MLFDMSLIAQAGEISTPTTITGTVICVCVSLVGLFAWLVRHLLTDTIPKQQQQFFENSHANRVLFASEMKEVRDTFSAEAKAQRDGCAADANELRELFAEQIKYEREASDRRAEKILEQYRGKA